MSLVPIWMLRHGTLQLWNISPTESNMHTESLWVSVNIDKLWFHNLYEKLAIIEIILVVHQHITIWK